MSTAYDALIVGGGHNGLVCGNYLARAGEKVCVVERRPIVGGAAVTEELWPGYKVSTASYIMSLMQPKIMLDLELAKHGMTVLSAPPAVYPLQDGRFFTFWHDVGELEREISRFSTNDARAYPNYRAHMMNLGSLFRDLIFETPVDPGSTKPKDLLNLARFAWRFRGIGTKFYDVYDLLTVSAYDYLGQWFESEDIKLVLGFFAGGGGGNASIRSPGTAYMLVRSFLRDPSTPAGPAGMVRGGMGEISNAIRRSGECYGLMVRTDAEVNEIVIENGAACGVRLITGEVIRSKIVVANTNAKTTFLKLVPRSALPEGFVKQIQNFRTHSTVFKINLALNGLPQFPTLPREEYPVQLTIGLSVDYMDQAHDEARYGRIAQNPFLIVKTPSVVDTTLAPAGHHVMNIFGGHAPYHLREGDWDGRRDELFKIVLRTLGRYSPDIEGRIVHRQVLTPVDLERVFDLPTGHVQHGEISSDQIFFRRPTRHYADYRSPIVRLYQCGASSHPGGGVTGVPGHNAARVILSDRKKWI